MLQVTSRQNCGVNPARSLGLALLAATAMASCAPAEPKTHIMTDAATGLGVSIAGDYRIEPEVPQAPYTATIGIKAPNGHPFIAEPTRVPICTASFQPMAEAATMTQAELNALAPQWSAEVEKGLVAQTNIHARQSFAFKGVSGHRLVLSPNDSLGAHMRVVLYVMVTPRGRTVLNCSGSADTLDAAMPTYELMRDGLTLP